MIAASASIFQESDLIADAKSIHLADLRCMDRSIAQFSGFKGSMRPEVRVDLLSLSVNCPVRVAFDPGSAISLAFNSLGL